MNKELFYSKTVLPSGIRVLTEHMDEVRSVAIGFWVGVGSRDESDRLNGMSHFLEHLLFKGTKTRSAKDISEAFESLGAEVNAFTAKEYTCFYSRLLDEHTPVGTEVLSDMLCNARIAERDVSFERNVVLEEINLHEDTPDERIHDVFATAMWPRHALGKTILGHSDTVSKFTRADVREFLDRYYSADNIVVAAAGHVDHDGLCGLVDMYLRPAEPGAPSGRETAAHSERRSIHRRPKRREVAPKVEARVEVYKKNTEQAHICYGTSALRAGHKDRFALTILDNVLGGGMSSRLFQEVREKRGLVYSVYTYHSLFTETGLFTAYAGAAPGNISEVIQVLRHEIENIAGGGVTADELHRAKEHLKGQLLLSLESTSQRMTRLGKLELTHGELLSVDELVERIEAVTREDVNRLAAEILVPERMVLTAIGPFERDTLAKMVA